jgi:hypothetical protein
MAIQDNNPSLMGFFIADVVENDPETRRLSVYIPKLMPAIPNGQVRITNVPTTNNPNITGAVFNPTIAIRNSIWVYPWDYDEALPKAGSKVTVRFFEGNPKMGYWDKFNPTANYEVIDEEKYPELFKINFSNVSVTANQDDIITITMPDSFQPILVENGKNKEIIISNQERYVVSDSRPENPIQGMLWYSTSNDSLYLFTRAAFRKVVLDDELELLYKQLEVVSSVLEDQVLSSRLIFVARLSDIAEPIENQIVAIDPARVGRGFFRYSRVDSEVTLEDEGFYFLSYSNFLKEVGDAGLVSTLKAYRYNGSSWVELDGWFYWTQPAELDAFSSSQNINNNFPYSIVWDYRDSSNYNDTELSLKFYSIKFEDFAIDEDSALELRFYSGNDYSSGVKIGSPFQIKNTGGVYSLIGDSAIYESSYLSGTTLFVPDISSFGVETTILKCEIVAVSGETASTTIDLGTVTINAKSNKEVE